MNTMQRRSFLMIIWLLVVSGLVMWFVGSVGIHSASANAESLVAGNLDTTTEPRIISTSQVGGNTTSKHYSNESNLPRNTPEGTFNVVWVSNDADYTSSMAWGDMDGDGDLDILAGNTVIDPGSGVNKVYRNDGGGVFTDVTNGDLAVDSDYTASVAWGDMDGDGDLDILAGNYEVNKVYRNDGEGVFTDITNGDLAVDSDSSLSVAWGDMDGDGDLDILAGNSGVSKVYRNDGGGAFTDITSGDLAADSDDTWSVAWGDMDGDGDLDILAGNDGVNKVYRNDGGGVFTDVTNGDLAVDSGYTASVAWGDMDGDGDLDVLAGNSDSFASQNKVYRNDGGGVFMNITGGDFAVDSDATPSVAWGDMDGDGDLDILAGNTVFESGSRVNKVYRNDGGGVFTDVTNGDLAVDSDYTASVAWGDMDGDGDLDILAGSNGQVNKVYRNDGGGAFTDITSGDLAADSDATYSVAWGDMDGDGDLDILAGNRQFFASQNNVYRNDGGGVFTDVTNGDLAVDSNYTTSVAWGDMDGDGDLDILAGNDGQVNKVYRNDGGGVFTDVTNGDLAVDSDYTASVAWGDMDGDGDLDILAGNTASSGQVNKVYRNDGGGVFMNITGGDLAVDSDRTWSVAWGDMDGDGDLDIIAGNYDFPAQVNKVYRNDGGGVFTDVTSGDLAVDSDATQSVAWGDMDGDGDLDILIGNDGQVNKVYRNDGGGVFTDVTNGDLAVDSDYTASVAWGDMDGDGDLDILAGNYEVNKVYRNDGGGVFTDITNSDLAVDPHYAWSVAWGDMDGDGDLDILAGTSGNNKVYRNPRNDGILTSNQTLVEIQLPEQIVGVNEYGIATTIAEQVINIPFTLQNAYEMPIGGVSVEYSLNGGGLWVPAISATGAITSPLTIGDTHIFQWDTLASGFFGQSNNVVLRMITHPQTANGMLGTFNYPHMVAGPIMYGSSSATTTPFRVRGTQVRVFSETVTVDNAASEAIVYRSVDGGATFDAMGNDETPFKTDQLGYLQGRGALGLGDQILALLPISTTENYTLYHTSATVDESGLADVFTVTAGGVQTLTVSADNPLAIFDLTVSLEWDARNDPIYLDQLERDLKRASEILYDLTNGQAALGKVTVYHEREQWNQADLVIHASNGVRPSAIAGGVVLTTTNDIDAGGTMLEDAYVPGQIRMGPTWNRFGEPGGIIGEDWPRTLAHELGHYLFFLPDNYLGINPNSGLLTLVDCVGSAMTDPYSDDYSEFLTPPEWANNTTCDNTLAEVFMGRGDWETINTFYPMLNGTTTNLGPNYLPLNLTQVQFVEPVTPTTTLADPFFSIVNESGGSFPIANGRGEAYLIKTGNDGDPTNDYVQALGSPVGSLIHARGAAVGDRLCVYDYSSTPLYYGCIESLGTFPTPITLRPIADWQPDIRVTEVNSQTFAITTTNVAESNLMVQLLPTFGPASAESPMTPTGNDFTHTITLPEPAFAGYARVWVPGSNPPQELIVDFISIEDWGGKALSWGGKALSWGGKALSWGGKALSWGAPTLSSDGQVALFPLDNPFADTTVYNLQKLSFLPTLDAWLTPVGQAYRVEVDGAMPASSIIFRYLGRDVDQTYENDLAVYFSVDNGQTWQRLSTEVDPTRNHAVAAASAEGIYVLALTIESAELHVGWNNVAYGVQTTRPVTVALASIDGSFTSVYWHDDANAGTWLLYDSTVEPPFADMVNTLEWIGPDAYWIYATEAVTWYVGVEQQPQRASETASTTFAPPATYYGRVAGAAVGDVISAEIDGTLCGQTTAVALDGGIAYSLNIIADNPFGQANGCGLPHRTVTFLLNGNAVAETAWDHTQAWQLDLESSVPTNIALNDRATTTRSPIALIVAVALTTLLSGWLATRQRS